MQEDDSLAAFQSALLELLDEQLETGEILRRLNTDVAFRPYRSYVASFEPRMVEVAAELVKKWSVRRR
jgi:hypothetical protein